MEVYIINNRGLTMKIKITNNIYEHETQCQCGCDLHTQPDIKMNIQILAYEIQKFISVLSVLYQEDRIEVVFDSWLRCPAHNEKEGGADNSWHMTGLSCDLRFYTIRNSQRHQVSPAIVARIALVLSRTDVLNFKGIGCYRGFNHLDLRNTGPIQWVQLDNGEKEYGVGFKGVFFGS
jgi:hypothetical protein